MQRLNTGESLNTRYRRAVKACGHWDDLVNAASL